MRAHVSYRSLREGLLWHKLTEDLLLFFPPLIYLVYSIWGILSHLCAEIEYRWLWWLWKKILYKGFGCAIYLDWDNAMSYWGNRINIVRFNFAVHTKFVDLIKLSADFHILALSWVISVEYTMIIYNIVPAIVRNWTVAICLVILEWDKTHPFL